MRSANSLEEASQKLARRNGLKWPCLHGVHRQETHWRLHQYLQNAVLKVVGVQSVCELVLPLVICNPGRRRRRTDRGVTKASETGGYLEFMFRKAQARRGRKTTPQSFSRPRGPPSGTKRTIRLLIQTALSASALQETNYVLIRSCLRWERDQPIPSRGAAGRNNWGAPCRPVDNRTMRE